MDGYWNTTLLLWLIQDFRMLRVYTHDQIAQSRRLCEVEGCAWLQELLLQGTPGFVDTSVAVP